MMALTSEKRLSLALIGHVAAAFQFNILELI